MIDLEKQKESSEEEIQEWVNEVYEYAVNLYTNHNMSWGEVRQELINQGLNVEDATTVISNLKQQEHEAKIDASNKELGYGALWALVGIALTAITDGAVIFYGAVLWGGWLLLKGIYHKIGKENGKKRIKHWNTWAFVLLEKGFRYNSGKTKNSSPNRHSYY